jgi:hypothetical protein
MFLPLEIEQELAVVRDAVAVEAGIAGAMAALMQEYRSQWLQNCRKSHAVITIRHELGRSPDHHGGEG